MPDFTPQFLAEAAQGSWTREPSADAPVTGFTVDTRHLEPGQCFVALKTVKRDGHAYVAAAHAAGASAAIVSVADPSLSLPQLVVADPLAAFQAIAAAHRRTFTGLVIGVTGSAGKTSTKELLALLLSSSPGDVLATQGNLNNQLGVPLTLTRVDPKKHRFAVIEAGIGGPGEMANLAAMIQPDHAVVTLIGPAHLAALGSLENIANEKCLLLAAVPETGFRVAPVGTMNYQAFRTLSNYSVVVPDIAQRRDSTRISLDSGTTGADRKLDFECRRLSEGMACNAAIALTVALRLGVTPEDAARRLALWQPAALRGEHVYDHAGRWLYVDCYNANPASMLDALDVFVGMAPPDQPRLFIIGGMEELGKDVLVFHRQLGEGLRQIIRPQDAALVLADNDIARSVVEGAMCKSVVATDSIGAIRARLEKHKGAVFIKGSRRYQLESLLLPNVVAAEVAGVGH
jgi:UDP-N-acetylmuramoyl-tripeptide--D-alanyl-D-alanine ligase